MNEPKDVTVDAEQRVSLATLAKAGEIYRVETPTAGQIILRRLKPAKEPTYDEALKAIRNSGLEFVAGYDELRDLTREP